MRKIVGVLLALLVVTTTADAQQPFMRQSLTAVSGACPDAGCMVQDVQGLASAGIQITGTWTATIQFEQSVDGTTFTTWAVTPNGGGAAVTSTTGNGLWFGPTAGARFIRTRVSAFTSGTAVITSQSTVARLAAPTAPAIVAFGRFTAQTAAKATVATFTPAADGTFEISGDITMTAFAAGAVRLQLNYNSEDNVGRALNVPLWNANAWGITAGAADVWVGGPITIRAKAGVAIVLSTAGTFTTVTYNVDGLIKQVG